MAKKIKLKSSSILIERLETIILSLEQLEKTAKNRSNTNNNKLSQTLLIIITACTVGASIWNTCEYKKATQDENRAYLSLNIIPDTVNHWGSIVVSVVNVGKTPALRVKHFWSFKIDTIGPNKLSLNEIKRDTSSLNDDYINAGISFYYPLNSRLNLNYETIDSISKWKKGLYYFGKFTYEDIYGNSHFQEYNVLYHAHQNKYLYLPNILGDEYKK
jgi:hypothetical protein